MWERFMVCFYYHQHNRFMTRICLQCNARPVRRACPALNDEICSICCGEGRENTISCPYDCEFLQEARRREKYFPPEQMPHAQVEVTDAFLRRHSAMVELVGAALAEAIARVDGLVDSDFREALEAAVSSRLTAQSGLIYTNRPSNPMAAAIHELIDLRIAEFQRQAQQQGGYTPVPDAVFLGVVAYYQRVALSMNNGRRRGCAFVDALVASYRGRLNPAEGDGASPPGIIVP
jgi:hypothetical protein